MGRVTLSTVLGCCTWGRRGSNGTCSTLCQISVTPSTTHNQIGPLCANSWVGEFVHTLGPCGSLQWPLLWGWEFLLLLPQPPRVFSVRGLRLYFPMLKPWVAQSASHPRCSSRFIYAQMWGRRVHNLPPRWVRQSPPCRYPFHPAASLCPSYWSGWMFLLYLLGCRTSIQLDFLSVLVGFCFSIVVVLLFWLCEEAQCVYHTFILARS